MNNFNKVMEIAEEILNLEDAQTIVRLNGSEWQKIEDDIIRLEFEMDDLQE